MDGKGTGERRAGALQSLRAKSAQRMGRAPGRNASEPVAEMGAMGRCTDLDAAGCGAGRGDDLADSVGTDGHGKDDQRVEDVEQGSLPERGPPVAEDEETEAEAERKSRPPLG